MTPERITKLAQEIADATLRYRSGTTISPAFTRGEEHGLRSAAYHLLDAQAYYEVERQVTKILDAQTHDGGPK